MGHWDFDRVGCIDSSGNRNHAYATCKQGSPAPGVFGVGNSINLTGGKFLEIPHSKVFDSEPFTITLWIFWISNSGTASICPML